SFPGRLFALSQPTLCQRTTHRAPHGVGRGRARLRAACACRRCAKTHRRLAIAPPAKLSQLDRRACVRLKSRKGHPPTYGGRRRRRSGAPSPPHDDPRRRPRRGGVNCLTRSPLRSHRARGPEGTVALRALTLVCDRVDFEVATTDLADGVACVVLTGEIDLLAAPA